MYKVVIVEDEMLVRLGLKNSVDWRKFGMEVAADLADGKAAWEYCVSEGLPDLIITDIRMPRMDGMALIEQVRQKDKETRIVVLSCLEEFELVRKAMAYGVSNYILKLTMTEEEIDGVLASVKTELDSRAARKDTNAAVPVMPGNLDLVKEKYVKDYLFYGINSPDELAQFIASAGLRLSPSRLVACTVEVDSYFVLKNRFKDKNGHLVKGALLNIFYEIMGTYGRGETIGLDETHYLLLFSFEDLASEQSIYSEVHLILNRIKDALQHCYNGSVSFGVSGVQSGYDKLRKLYFESMNALENKFYTGPGQKHTVNDKPDYGRILNRIEQLRDYMPLRELLSPIRQSEYDQYLKALSDGLAKKKSEIKIIVHSLVQWLNAGMAEAERHEQSLLFQVTERLNACDTLPEMLDHVRDYAVSAVELSRSYLQMSSEITKAVQFIKQHYDRNISLQQVADHVNLSFGYLSNLFKKELQITFVEYLNGYRIERAKELLTRTNMKSYDVAVKVGFSPEYTYFSKVFKKTTGLNPNEYRRQHAPEAGRTR